MKQTFKTEICVSYSYNSYSLIYKKLFDLPFIPTIGTGLIFNDKNEYDIQFKNNDNCITSINYNIEKQKFEINVRNILIENTSNETIDYIVKKYSDWNRIDDTNINDLKKYINHYYI